MATRPVVPRANGEGSIGTAAKHWGNGYFDELNTDLIVPPLGSTNNSVGASDRKWKEGHFENLVADDVIADTVTSEKIIADDVITKGPVVDVRAFGAKGDGVTNDTQAFNAALEASGEGGVVYLPKGTYLIDFSAFLLSYKEIYGAGQNQTIIKQRNSNIPFCVVRKRCSLHDFSIIATNNTQDTDLLPFGFYNETMDHFNEHYIARMRFDCDEHTTVFHIHPRGFGSVGGTIEDILIGKCKVGVFIDAEGWFTTSLIQNIYIKKPTEVGFSTWAKDYNSSTYSQVSAVIVRNIIVGLTNSTVKGFILSQITAINFSNLYVWLEEGSSRNNIGLSFRNIEALNVLTSEPTWETNTLRDCQIEGDIENIVNGYGFIASGVDWHSTPLAESDRQTPYILNLTPPSIIAGGNFIGDINATDYNIDTNLSWELKKDEYGYTFLSITNPSGFSRPLTKSIGSSILQSYTGYVTAYAVYEQGTGEFAICAYKDNTEIENIDTIQSTRGGYNTPTVLHPNLKTRVVRYYLIDFNGASDIKFGIMIGRNYLTAAKIYKFDVLIGYQNGAKIMNMFNV